MTTADIRTFEVSEADQGVRLDKFLSRHCTDLSRNRLQALIAAQAAEIDGESAEKASEKLKTGQVILIEVPPAEEYHVTPENIPLDIIYEDDDLLVINKHPDMVVHPAAGNWTGTLVHALLYHCGKSLSGIGGVMRPGIVHRLDKGTSGLMVAAKNDAAHRHLSLQLADRSLSRTYHALVIGVPQPRRGIINKPLARHPKDRLRIAVRRDGREAVTHFELLENYKDALSLVECVLETGRTHQIRVHMAETGHPLLGDPLYGAQPTKVSSVLKNAGYAEPELSEIKAFPRQALHASGLSLIHPRTEEEMDFACDLPDDLQRIVDLLS